MRVAFLLIYHNPSSNNEHFLQVLFVCLCLTPHQHLNGLFRALPPTVGREISILTVQPNQLLPRNFHNCYATMDTFQLSRTLPTTKKGKNK